MGLYEGLALELKDQVIAELKQALAEKDTEIESRDIELGKLDAELIVRNAAYQQLMEKAVRWASYITTIHGKTWEAYKDAEMFLDSPEFQAWKEHQS